MAPDKGSATVASKDKAFQFEVGKRAADRDPSDAKLLDEVHLLR